jgi:hypothetical protein
MTEEKIQIAGTVLIIVLLLVIFFMILARNVSLEIFFVLWLIALLIIVELIGPSFVKPPHLRLLTYLVVAGVIVFAVIVVQKVMEILGA